MKPLVSVVIPVHNGAAHLTETIESVFVQDYAPLELIAVDDGSTDGSADILRAFPRVTCLTQPNSGVAAARNRGAQAAQGELIAFLDQDDVWLPEKLSEQVAYLETHPEAHYVTTAFTMFLTPGVPVPAWVRPEWLAAPATGAMPSTLLVWRAAFERIGGFDPAFAATSDADWFFRAKDAKLTRGHLSAALTRKRVHATNQSSHVKLTQRELVQIARASIQRKNRGGS